MDYYPLSDLLYRSVALTDTTPAIQEAYDTDAYGNTLVFSDPDPADGWFGDDDGTTDDPTCTFVFTGRRFDPETDIYFYRARYYHTELGRFVSRDTEESRAPISLYLYVGARPACDFDPYGLRETQASQGLRKRKFIVYDSSAEAYLRAAWGIAAVPAEGQGISAGSVKEMVDKILEELGPCECIESIRIWGHGNVGTMTLGDSHITAKDFSPGSSDYADFSRLRDRMCDPCYVCFSGCLTLRGRSGARLAERASSFFGCTVGGYTEMTGYWLLWPGYVEVAPGENASYPTSNEDIGRVREGFSEKMKYKKKAKQAKKKADHTDLGADRTQQMPANSRGPQDAGNLGGPRQYRMAP